jgi:hypothetical protein
MRVSKSGVKLGKSKLSGVELRVVIRVGNK